MYGKFTRHLDLNEIKKTKNQHTRIIGIYSHSQYSAHKNYIVEKGYHLYLNLISALPSFYLVDVLKETKLSTKNFQCNSDPNYNFHKCIDSYFYKLRGCQYPWNVYDDLNLPVCANLTARELMAETYDPSLGKGRESVAPSEQMKRTNGSCLTPCKNTLYNIKLEKLDIAGKGNSFQIAFPDFSIKSSSEYFACEWTCIVGELGGNLGFFLGGSIIFAIDLLIEYVRRLIDIIKMKY